MLLLVLVTQLLFSCLRMSSKLRRTLSFVCHVHDEIYTSLLPYSWWLAKALQRRGCFFLGDLEGMEWGLFAFTFFLLLLCLVRYPAFIDVVFFLSFSRFLFPPYFSSRMDWLLRSLTFLVCSRFCFSLKERGGR